MSRHNPRTNRRLQTDITQEEKLNKLNTSWDETTKINNGQLKGDGTNIKPHLLNNNSLQVFHPKTDF